MPSWRTGPKPGAATKYAHRVTFPVDRAGALALGHVVAGRADDAGRERRDVVEQDVTQSARQSRECTSCEKSGPFAAR